MSLLDARDGPPGGPSFSIRNRILRVIWQTAWLVLCRFTPPPFHPWRGFVLRCFGARIGRGVRVHGSVHVWLPRNLDLGDRVLIGPGVRLYNQGRIAVGAGTVVSQRAHICASSHDLDDPNFQLVLRPVTIGKNCWIAAEAFVGPGVTMADRAVLAARAALFGHVPADAIYSGNPAAFLKMRSPR